MACPLFTRTTTKLFIMLGVLLTIFNPSHATCGVGCLACSEDSTSGEKSCLVCDIYSSYIKNSDGKCELNQIPNCEVASLDRFTSVCLQCEPRYVLDNVLGRCVSIQFASVVADCYRYTSLSTCLVCNPDHYLFAGKCIKNETPVDNCKTYTAEGVCGECELNYFLEDNVCKQFPQTKGCANYSHYHCDQCKPGFSRDLNFYMRQTVNKSYVQSIALAGINTPQVLSGSQENCLKDKVEFCVEHTTPDRCYKCLAGYYVTSKGTCEKYPINRIKECLRYKNKSTCEECEPLFYLNGNECSRRTLYSNCSKYKINLNECERCEDDYYLTNATTCTKRNVSLTGCKVKTADKQECDTCEDNYQKNDQMTCFLKKANCVTHDVATASSNYMKCTVCDSKYFLIDGTPSNTCTAFEYIPNCKDRTANRNECSECVYGYYVDSSTKKCSPHTARFCEVFDKNNDKCETCIGGFEKNTTINKCVMTRVDNCKEISSTPGQCQTCLDGFYKNANGLCKTHNLVGCLEPEENKNECKSGRCKSGYYRDKTTFLCKLHMIANCKDYKTDERGCDTCETGFKVDNFGHCIKSQTDDPNCNTFTDGKCSACKTPLTHYLQPIIGTCIERANTQNCTAYESKSDECTDCTDASYYLLDGVCLKNEQNNCSKIKDDSDECQECEENYYLDPLLKTCQPNIFVGCKDQSDNFGFGCKKCDSGWVLNSVTKLCEEVYIPNCKDYVENKHECLNCEKGFFKGKDSRCYFYGKLGCKKMSGVNEEKCTECLDGFYLSGTDCLLLDQPHCKVHSTSPLNNNCFTCHSGFYESSGTCLPQYKANCLTYTANTNNCTKCENLYWVSSNNCVELTADKKNNCAQSDGIADACSVCNSQYKKGTGGDVGKCVVVASAGLTTSVPFCFGNNSTTDTMCNMCQSGFVLSDIVDVVMEKPTGCATVDRNETYLCTQCIEGWQFNATIPGICEPVAEAYTGDCIQGKNGVKNKTLATINTQVSNNECVTCRDYQKSFLNSEKCTNRTKIIPGCESYKKTQDTCDVCLEGLKPSGSESFTNCVMDNGSGKIANCAVYKITPFLAGNKECLICVPGWYGTLCDKKNTFEISLYDNDLIPNTAILSSATLTGFTSVELNYQSSSNATPTIKPTVCSDGKTRVLGTYLFSSTSSITSTFNPFTLEHENHIGYGVGNECVAKDDARIQKDGSNPFEVWTNDQCAVAYYLEDTNTNKIICVACKPGYIGEVKTVGSDHQISKCHEAYRHNLEKKYKGIGHKPFIFAGSSIATDFPINFPDLFHYDSCSNDAIPVAIYKLIIDNKGDADSSNDRKRYVPDGLTGSPYTMKCVSNLNTSKLIEGCQVYGYETSTKNNPDFSNSSDATVTCLACKPGWKSASTHASQKYVANTCERIENCDLNSINNNKLGICAECKEGYVHHYNDTTRGIEYYKCVKPEVENCEFYNSTEKKCFLCKKGYFFNANKDCVDFDDMYCKVSGSNIPYYNHSGTDVWKMANLLEIKQFYKNTYNGKVLSSNCSQCKEGFVSVRNVTGSQNICSSRSINKNKDHHCSQYNFADNCIKCETNYVLKDTTCIANDSSKNGEKCLKVSNNSNQTCVKCSDNYSAKKVSATQSTCVMNPNCIKSTIASTNGFCTICHPGYYMTSEYLCEKIHYASPCLVYEDSDPSISIQNRECLICKDRNMIPYNKKHDGDSRIIEIDCRSPPLLEKTAYLINVFLMSGNKPKIKSIPSNYLIPEIVGPNLHLAQFQPTKNTIANVACVPEFRQYLNCKTFASDSIECATCNSGFFLNEAKVCIQGQIPRCEEYQDAQTCMKCVQGYFPSATVKSVSTAPFYQKGCLKYTVDCLEFDPNRDSCRKCKNSTYLDITTSDTKYQCKPYSVNNCAIFAKNADKCRVCEEGSYHDSTGACVPIKVNNCLVYSATSDTCLSCAKGFYLDPKRHCVGHSVFNCDVFDEYSDKCDSCKMGYFKNSDGLCQLNTLEGCAAPKRNENKCLFCKDGFYKDEAAGRCKLYTVTHCKNYHPLKDECVDCDDSSWQSIANRTCFQYADARNCSVFNRYEDKCKACKPGFYLSTLNSLCVQYKNPNCSSYKWNRDECTSCMPSYYLDGTVCRPVTAINCLTFDPFSNECGSCLSDYYKDLSTGNCLMYTEEFCRTYDPFANKCVTCREYHYLTKEGKCIPYSIQNCENFAYNANACLTCRRGYYLDVFTRQCHPYLAKNCSSYDLNKDWCNSCVPEYYLKQGKCSPYTVSNCLKRDPNNDRCIGCLSNHYFSAGKCLPFTVKHCRSFSTTKDECMTCQNGFYFEFDHCLPYTAQYCASHDPNRDLCSACDFSGIPVYKDDFTLLCNPHTLVNHCETYSKTENKCSQCILGYYLEDNMCVANPPGIPNCMLYLDKDVCFKCEAGYYLRNNVCFTPKTLIKGCSEYSSSDCCEKCSSGFALNENFKCDTIVETSCATWKDAENCATCGYNQVIQLNDNDKQTCVNSNISHCASATNSAKGPQCIKCENGYFLSDNKCLYPNTLVSNCLEYFGHGQCSRCNDNYLLSKDKSACTTEISKAGSQCMVGYESLKPKCSVCSGGYFFDQSGACQQCSTEVANCALCDINNLSRCLICQSGYHMMDDYSCKENPVIIPPVATASVYTALIMLGLSLLIWK